MKNSACFFAALLGALTAFISPSSIAGNAVENEKGHEYKSVLVELFTSEGCSSCPPADEVLKRLQREQPVPNVHIITLSEGVTYWDYLGWKDPLASETYTRRQSGYASALHRPNLYTPQMVVDGKTEFVGSNFEQAKNAIRAAATADKAKLQATAKWQVGKINVSAELHSRDGKPVEGYSLFAAVVEDNVVTSVARGENSGRRLAHHSVARELVKLGQSSSGASGLKLARQIEAKSEWSKQNLRIVLFAQDDISKSILGCTECAIVSN